MAFDLISIGDSGIDTLVEIHEASLHCFVRKEECQICFNYADKILADDVHTKTAYNAMNNAVGSARLGLKTAFYTHVGAEPNGRRIVEALRHEGIDDRYTVVEAKKRSNASVVINFRGERTILVYHEQFRYRLPRFASTRWFYLTSMGHNFLPFCNAFARSLRRRPAKLGFNPGTFQLRAGPRKLRPILQATTALFLNKEEARLFTGIHEERDVRELLRGMVKLGPSVAVITDGPKGAYAASGEQVYFMKVFPAPIVERTGAGDSFATAFVAALAHGHDTREALRWGAVNSAAVIQKIGPQDGLLRLADLRRALRRHPRFQPRPI
jgi:sugar/nucleoside kinase (ribokinase family)